MKEKFKVVLLGSDDNVYGISRSFYEEYEVKSIALCARHLTPTKHSKIVEVKVIKDFNKESVCINKLIEYGKYLKEKYEILLLVPCSDSYMELVIKHKDKLESIYENKFIDKKILDNFITKDKFYKLCDKYNLKYPKTKIVKLNERNSFIDKLDFKYPLVLKPNNSNSKEYLECSFPNKKKVFIINNKTELINIINDINNSSYKDNLIIQEFIKGDDTFDRVINVYSDSNGLVKMMALGNPILEEYAPYVLGNYAAIITYKGYNPLFDKIKRMLEDLHYVGFSNFDIKYDIDRNEYYLFEINYRQGRSSYSVDTSGISLARLLVEDYVLKEDIKEVIYPKKDSLWININLDTLFRYISDKDILLKVKSLISNNECTKSLYYEKDNNILRNIRIKRLYYVKDKQFKEYYIQK